LVGIHIVTAYKPIQMVLLALITIVIYFTKPAFAPFTPVFLGWIGAALILHRKHFSLKVQRFAAGAGLVLLMLLVITNAHNLEWVFTSLFQKEANAQSRWFGMTFWKDHLPEYVQALFGRGIPFLWDRTPMVNFWVGVGGMIGLLYLAIKKRSRWIGLLFLTVLWSQILFIASFYALDGRYIYHAIPIILIGLAATLESLRRILNRYHQWLFLSVLVVLSGFYLYQNAIRLKSQIMVNLKYAEQPWWYLSIKHLDQFLIAQPKPEQGKQYLIVAHPPFLFDFYAKGEYELLPLTPLQDFRQEKRPFIWGPYDYTDYLALYQSLLEQGHTLYLTNYGLGNDKGYHADFTAIEKSFTVTLLQQGCYGLCNIYRVELPDETK
jgi:hypothetical protein